jgi:hypothetical protein
LLSVATPYLEGAEHMCDEILLRLGLLNAEQLDAARAMRLRESRPLTECLVRAGAIDEAALVDALAGALRLPTVTAAHLFAVDAGVAALLPRELAVELRAFPVAVDDELITIAFADAADEAAVSEATFFVGRAVARAIAPPLAICAALERRFDIQLLSERRPIASHDSSTDSHDQFLAATTCEAIRGGC